METIGSGFAQLLMYIGFGIGLGTPIGLPPKPEDPALFRIAPQACVFYTAWAGTGQPNPQSGNQTEQLLAEPQVRQSMQDFQDLVFRGLSKLGQFQGITNTDIQKDALEVGRALMSHPVAVFIASVKQTPRGLEAQAGAAVNLGKEAAKIRGILERDQQTMFSKNVESAAKGEITWYHIHPSHSTAVVTWGMMGNYLILGIGDGAVQGIVQRIHSESSPQWLTAIGQQLPVDRRVRALRQRTRSPRFRGFAARQATGR